MEQVTRTDWMSAAMELVAFTGPVAQFWAQYHQLVRTVTDASEASVYTRSLAPEPGAWMPILNDATPFDSYTTPDLLRQLKAQGQTLGKGTAGQLVGLTIIPIGQADREFVLLLSWARSPAFQAALPAHLATLSVLPAVYEGNRKERSAARDAQRFGQTLALVGAMLDADGFDMAASVLVNRLTELFACETVFLCWCAREGQKLRAVSHGEIPDRRSQETALVEDVSQESLIQQCEVVFPSGANKVVSFAAERYADLSKPGHMITLPLIHYGTNSKGRKLGGITLCRRRVGFTEAEQWVLRMICEMVQPILENNFKTKHWLLRRLGRELVRSMPKALRAKTLSGKVLLWSGVVALVGLMFLPIPFRIYASAVVKTDAMGFVSAPFNGFIQDSSTILGGSVQKGQVLFTLLDAELKLEREGLLAELAQANRNTEVNRSLGKLSEMLVAQARGEEIKSQLLRLDRQIASADGLAPLDGVVIEGEPAKRLGQAVNRGDAIVTVAALTNLYIEAAVSERDLGFVAPVQGARLTLLANPKERFDVVLGEVVPSASVQDTDNVFPVRMAYEGVVPDWWLPGMTGVIRINAGRAALGWVASRRLIDYLRLKLWF